MSQRVTGIIAIFPYLDDVTNAIKHMRGRTDFARHDVYTPTSYHDIEEESQFGASPVRFFTLIGALTGMVTGFALCLAIDYDWPLVVGGKTPGVASLPAFVIIAFELAILFGAFGTIFAMLWYGRLANPMARIHDRRTTDDTFAIVLPGASTDSPQAQLFKQWGATEVKALH
jgi:hypothetical protein